MTKTETKTRNSGSLQKDAEKFIRNTLSKNFDQKIETDELRAAAQKLTRVVPDNPHGKRL